MKTYLVTGAAGFIGAAVAKRLIDNGDRVATIDNLSTGYEENIPAGCEFIKGGCHEDSVIASLAGRKFDAIIHIAGQSSGEVSFENPVYDLQTNTQSTLMLLKHARENGCRRFIYAGSSLVYGDHGDVALREDMHCVPKSFYGVGKLASEHYMRIYRQYGVEPTSLRMFNVYGPGQNMANLRQGMVSIYMALAFAEKKITVKGSLERFRDLIYIDDVADAFALCLENSATHGKEYNLGTGVKTRVADLVKLIAEKLPFDVEIAEAEGTPGDLFGSRADISLLEKDTGWRPQTDVVTGVSTMIERLIATGYKG